MIYIYKTDIEQTVVIPNASGTDNGIGAATFELTGAASGLPKVTIDVSVTSVWKGLYFHVNMAGMGIAPKGEFNFTLKDGAVVLAHGVARVIEWTEEPIEDGTSQNIIQYE